MYSKKTRFKRDSVEQHLLNMVTILSSRFYLGLYTFKRKAYFALVNESMVSSASRFYEHDLKIAVKARCVEQ